MWFWTDSQAFTHQDRHKMTLYSNDAQAMQMFDQVISLFCPVNVYILQGIVCLHLPAGDNYYRHPM